MMNRRSPRPDCDCCRSGDAGVRRLGFVALALLIALIQPSAAFAHASLVRADPADGVVIADAPRAVRLMFNEPVAPLVMRLIAPDGKQIEPKVAAENATISLTPPLLQEGTHVLNWRVVSADGHPVGGALMFSVGAPSAQPPAHQAEPGDAVVSAALWLAKVLIYTGLFIGIGGAFFRAWLLDPKAARTQSDFAGLAISAALAAGLFAAVVSVGLQGLDARALPITAFARTSTKRFLA